MPWNSPTERASVVRVIDGVTIEALVGGETLEVRYIGIDMLEYESDWTVWERSTAKNQELVEGEQVLLIEGLRDSDEEGRLLRFVMAGSVFVNQELIESGYAAAQNQPEDPSCAETFRGRAG